jgi:hypothetical protein
LPFIVGYKFETQPGLLNLDGYAMYYFAAILVPPAMEMKMVGQGSQYAWAVEDANRNSRDGKNYKCTCRPTFR